jgi:hypothetical protein
MTSYDAQHTYTIGVTPYYFVDVTKGVQDITTTYSADLTAVGTIPTFDTINTGTEAGPTPAAGNKGDSFQNSGREFVYIKNADAVNPLTVRFIDQSFCDHDFEHDVIATVPTSNGKFFGPFPVNWFTGVCLICYGTPPTQSTVTTATIGVFLPESGAGAKA